MNSRAATALLTMFALVASPGEAQTTDSAASFIDRGSGVSLDQAIEVARQLKPKRTIFTHICHDLGHAKTNAMLPEGMELGYDGQRIGLT